ncbi:MAG: tRNA(Ile)-lysidine synthase [Planctomycetota bacterium]|jgi:tRNA(Ile)-lysidine synthase
MKRSGTMLWIVNDPHESSSASLPSWLDLCRKSAIAASEPLLVAISGGADSVWLLRSLAAANWPAKVAGVHVNHGLRGSESDADQEFCRQLCDELGVDFHSARVELGTGQEDLERRAREARYHALGQVALRENFRSLLLAHHADDALETLIMRWARGTSLYGLANLRVRADFPIRMDGNSRLQLLRPLLDLRASQLREDLVRRGHSWREDSSNLSTQFTRNRVRNQLLPWFLQNAGTEAGESLRQFHDALQRLDRVLEEASPELDWHCDALGVRSLPLDSLRFLEEPILRRSLWQLITKITEHAPRDQSLTEITSALRSRTNLKLTIKSAWNLRLAARRLQLWPVHRPACLETSVLREVELPARLELSGNRVLRAELIEVDQDCAAPNSDCEVHLACPDANVRIELRMPRPGDRFHALGAPGSKLLRRFLTACGVPAELRHAVPLVFVGDELAWVAGLRPCHALRVLPTTRQRLWLRLETPQPSTAQAVTSEGGAGTLSRQPFPAPIK